MKIINKRKYIIATIRQWNIEEARGFINNNADLELLFITNKEELNYQKIAEFNPRYIFFPHCPWIIQEEIYNNFECIVFHMTDLPFGRGGSPLQNLILRGINKTKISAIKTVKELDAGPVYMKKDLSLEGSAEEIYKRASKIVFRDMIPYIIQNEPKPILQVGKIEFFKRRKPEESKIPKDINLEKIYNFIRMLDAEDYPHAYLETGNLRLKFTQAVKGSNFIEAKVHISIKERQE